MSNRYEIETLLTTTEEECCAREDIKEIKDYLEKHNDIEDYSISYGMYWEGDDIRQPLHDYSCQFLVNAENVESVKEIMSSIFFHIETKILQYSDMSFYDEADELNIRLIEYNEVA